MARSTNATRAQQQVRALNMKLGGATEREIAEKLGVGKSTAHRYLADALAELKREPAELVIDQELRRLDKMLMALWPKAIRGEEKAIDRVLKLMDRRAKYYALDELAVMKLATDTKSLSAVDAWAKAMLGGGDQVDFATILAEQAAE